jgi:hypothetical protein
MYQRLTAICKQRYAPIAIIAFSALLVSPSLFVGLAADDFIHGLVLTRSQEFVGYAHGWQSLFQFATPATDPSLFADGILAWWADPNFKLSFLRPVSALTHVIDYALWPKLPFLMHAHSLIYFLLTLLAAFQLYRHVLKPRWVAVFALFLYAVDTTHAIAVAWIANRNASIACALSMFAVVVHLRAQPESRRARWAAAALFGAAMLAGEAALGAACYLIAGELFLAKDALKRRILRLLPWALVALVCVGTAHMLGYGTAGSGEYLDPFHDPAAYLHALPSRCLALLGADFALAPPEWWNAYDLLLPGARQVFIVIALTALCFWAWLLAPLVRRSASARFFLCGALLSLLPAAATFPHGRMMGFASIGLMGLLAEYIGAYVEGAFAQLRFAGLGAALVIWLHVILSPLSLAGGSWAMHDVRLMLERTDRTVPSSESIRAQDVIFINPPQDPIVIFSPARRALLGIPRPHTQRWLATGLTEIRVTRIDARTLELEPTAGFVREQTERVARGNRPFEVDQRIDVPGMHVRVMSLTADGRPQRARFRFDLPLEDARYVWRVWLDENFVAFQPPPVSTSVIVPRADFSTMLLGTQHPVTRLLNRLRSPLTNSGIAAGMAQP